MTMTQKLHTQGNGGASPHPARIQPKRNVKRLAIELTPDDWRILLSLQDNLAPMFGRLSQASIVRYALRQLAERMATAPVDLPSGPPVVAPAGPGVSCPA